MSWLLSLLKDLFLPRKKQDVPYQVKSETLPPGRAAKRLVLAELRDVLTRKHEAADALDDKLKNLLESATLVITIVTTLQIATGASQAGWIYWLILIVTLGVYVALIITTLRGLRPMDYHSPIPSTWEEIAKRFFALDEDAALDLVIANYLKYNKENNAPLDLKARKVRVASYLLAAIVVLLMVMGLLGLGNSIGFPWQSTSKSTTPTSTPTLQLPSLTPTVAQPTLQQPTSTPAPTTKPTPTLQQPTSTPVPTATPTPTIQSPAATPAP
jgi:hypothetical protein